MIGAHGRLFIDVRVALRLEVDDLAVARDQRDDARDVACPDVFLHDRVHALQPLGRQAHVLRGAARNGPGIRGVRHEEGADERQRSLDESGHEIGRAHV